MRIIYKLFIVSCFGLTGCIPVVKEAPPVTSIIQSMGQINSKLEYRYGAQKAPIQIAIFASLIQRTVSYSIKPPR